VRAKKNVFGFHDNPIGSFLAIELLSGFELPVFQ